MSKEKKANKVTIPCFDPCCCKLNTVEVDKRGQILLPKKTREELNIAPGDTFVLFSGVFGGDICCMLLLREEQYSEKKSENPPKSILNWLVSEQLGWCKIKKEDEEKKSI